MEDDVCFDDIHDNYYHNLTKTKEWLDEGDTGLTACDKCGLVQSWEGEVFAREMIGKKISIAIHTRSYAMPVLMKTEELVVQD